MKQSDGMFILHMKLAIAIGFVVSLTSWFKVLFVVLVGLLMQCQIYFCLFNAHW